MTDQLPLLNIHPAWRLDAATRELGRRRVADARKVLRTTRARESSEPEASPLPDAA